MSGSRSKCRCRLRHSTKSAARLPAAFKTRRNRTEQQRSVQPRKPSRKIFRPQNCGAVAHTLPVTGQVEDDPRLSRLYNRFYVQGDRSITSAERADRKLARL